MDEIKKVNELLKNGEPHNTTTDHKGYSGYKPQSVIDCVNAAQIEWDLELVEHGTRDSGRTNKNGSNVVDAFAHVRITMNGQHKDAFASHPILDDYGDAVKSAQTDAMKKAFSYFSIGNRAYHGLLGSSKDL